MTDKENKSDTNIPKFKVGDKVTNITMKGKIIKIEYNEHFGYVYLVRYSLFKKLWTMGLCLELGWE